MRTKLFIFTGLVTSFIASSGLRADVLEMQNGDRYSGKVLSVSADIVVLNSEILGKINVPRNKVVGVKFGAGAVGLQPECFVDRRGGGGDDRPPTPHSFEQFGRGETKKEAQHRRCKVRQHVGHVMAERGAN